MTDFQQLQQQLQQAQAEYERVAEEYPDQEARVEDLARRAEAIGDPLERARAEADAAQLRNNMLQGRAILEIMQRITRLEAGALALAQRVEALERDRS